MFDEIIRTLSQQWGLGTNARPFVQMLLAKLSDPKRGGFAGFIQRMRDTGQGSTVDTWMRSPKTAVPVSGPDLERAIGDNNLISDMTERFGVDRSKVTGALDYAVPAIVGVVAKDGVVPSALPAEAESFIGERSAWMGAVPVRASQAASQAASQTVSKASQTASQAAQTVSHKASQAASQAATVAAPARKWLPWIVAAVIILLLLGYCSMQNRSGTDLPATTTPAETTGTTPAADTTPVPGTTQAPDAAARDTTPAPGATPAPDASTPEATAPGTTPAPVAETETETMTEIVAPEGAAVVTGTVDGKPLLRVFFDVGKTAVSNEFQENSTALVEYMQANPDVVALIFGFNDPTGDPAVNAKLAKGRAEAVQKKLVAAGVPKERTRLEKPDETTGTADTNAASRRVDVILD